MKFKREKRVYKGPSPAWAKKMNALALKMFQTCHELLKDAEFLDTNVRDDCAQGVAYLVHAAYDCRACSLGLKDDAFHSFVANCTAEWFRQKGYADWFCSAAAGLFHASRPPIFISRVRVRCPQSRRKTEKKRGKNDGTE